MLRRLSKIWSRRLSKFTDEVGGPPRVLFLGRGVYDYLEATLVEGLISLGYQVEGIHAASFVERVVDLRDCQHDHSIVLSNKENFKRVKLKFLRGDCRRFFFVDGRDDPYIFLPGLLKSDFYLKRELLAVPFRPNHVLQLGFGVESRYLPNELLRPWEARQYDVFCAMSLGTNRARRVYLEVVKSECKRFNLTSFTESTGERAYNNKSGGPIPTPRYYEGLSNSKVVLSVFGAGQDCARFWEALARGALLLSEKPSIVGYRMPQHGEHCIYFRGTKELAKWIKWIFDHPVESQRIAQQGHQWALKNRTPGNLIAPIFLNQHSTSINKKNGLFRALYIIAWGLVYNANAFFYLNWCKRVRHKII